MGCDLEARTLGVSLDLPGSLALACLARRGGVIREVPQPSRGDAEDGLVLQGPGRGRGYKPRWRHDRCYGRATREARRSGHR